MGPDKPGTKKKKTTTAKPSSASSYYDKPGNRPRPAKVTAPVPTATKGPMPNSAWGAGAAAAAPSVAARQMPTGQAIPGQASSGLGMKPNSVAPGPGAGRAGPVTGMPQSQSVPGQNRSGLGAPALPTPSTAKGYQEGLKIGAAKVAKKALAPKTSTPPKARPSTFKPEPTSGFGKKGLAGALARNKGNNEAKALERMKKASNK
jgi:hypothetical protein